MQQDFEKLQKQMDDLQRDVDFLKSKELSRFSDPSQKQDFENLLSDSILDTVWNDYFYYYIVVNEQVAPSGNSIGDTDASVLQSFSDKQTSLTEEARMRTGMYITNGGLTTGFTGYILMLDTSDILNTYNRESGCGFKFEDDGTIHAVSINDSNETTFATGFKLDDFVPADKGPFYILECRLFPGERVDYYVNNESVGSISKNIPTISTRVPDIWSARIRNEVTQFSDYKVQFVEFAQRRKKINT